MTTEHQPAGARALFAAVGEWTVYNETDFAPSHVSGVLEADGLTSWHFRGGELDGNVGRIVAFATVEGGPISAAVIVERPDLGWEAAAGWLRTEPMLHDFVLAGDKLVEGPPMTAGELGLDRPVSIVDSETRRSIGELVRVVLAGHR